MREEEKTATPREETAIEVAINRIEENLKDILYKLQSILSDIPLEDSKVSECEYQLLNRVKKIERITEEIRDRINL